jgi:hypothetical protein
MTGKLVSTTFLSLSVLIANGVSPMKDNIFGDFCICVPLILDLLYMGIILTAPIIDFFL